MEEKMSIVTLRLPEDQHQRLKSMAQARGISLNKLFEQLTAQALTENDIELRYRRLAALGSAVRRLALLDKLDRADNGH
ncbi:MAG: toxin-antitoxin system HicB family antitoxin [Cypionkella sp.]